jgi:hypothetical protein
MTKQLKQGDVASGSGAGLDAAARKELEVHDNAQKALFPSRPILGLDCRKRARNAMPSLLD